MPDSIDIKPSQLFITVEAANKHLESERRKWKFEIERLAKKHSIDSQRLEKKRILELFKQAVDYIYRKPEFSFSARFDKAWDQVLTENTITPPKPKKSKALTKSKRK